MVTTEQWLAGIGKGWHPIVKPLVERAQAAGVEIHQIKEKFGGLRFYVGSASDAFHEAIETAERHCARTCEECGDVGKLRTGGWLKTLCDVHAAGRPAVGKKDAL